MKQTWTFPLRINSGPICTVLSVQSVSVHLSHLVHFLSINKYWWLLCFKMLLLVVLLSLPESEAEKTNALLSILYTLHSSKDFPGIAILTALCFSAFNATECVVLWSFCCEQSTPSLQNKPPGKVCRFCFPISLSFTDALGSLHMISSAWHTCRCQSLCTNLEAAAFLSSTTILADETVLWQTVLLKGTSTS